jgi:hypothetical protein
MSMVAYPILWLRRCPGRRAADRGGADPQDRAARERRRRERPAALHGGDPDRHLPLFFMAMAMYYFDGYEQSTGARVASNGSTVGKSIFEACVQVLPPIVTLVLGGYFGRRKEGLTP